MSQNESRGNKSNIKDEVSSIKTDSNFESSVSSIEEPPLKAQTTLKPPPIPLSPMVNS